MKGTIAIIAALPGELKPLVSPRTGPRWERLKAPKGTVLWIRPHPEGQWIAGCAGMGGRRAMIALREIERYVKEVDVICSVGWAGALDRDMSAASVWHIGEVVDTQTGEHFATAQASGRTGQWPILATSPRVADAAEKVRLAATYRARLVDMEAATLARIAHARGLPFFCLKAVSDDVDAKLPDMNAFIRQDGRLRMMPFAAHIAMRPASWRGMVQLGRYSASAARHLAEAIQLWLDEPVGTATAPPAILEST